MKDLVRRRVELRKRNVERTDEETRKEKPPRDALERGLGLSLM